MDSAQPAPRWDHTLAADEVGGRLVLFGGRDEAGAPLGDTWLFDLDAESWGAIDAPGPSPRFGHAVAVDEEEGDGRARVRAESRWETFVLAGVARTLARGRSALGSRGHAGAEPKAFRMGFGWPTQSPLTGTGSVNEKTEPPSGG